MIGMTSKAYTECIVDYGRKMYICGIQRNLVYGVRHVADGEEETPHVTMVHFKSLYRSIVYHVPGDSKCVYPLILIGGHLSFEWVTFSPSPTQAHRELPLKLYVIVNACSRLSPCDS